MSSRKLETKHLLKNDLQIACLLLTGQAYEGALEWCNRVSIYRMLRCRKNERELCILKLHAEKLCALAPAHRLFKMAQGFRCTASAL
jgi:hypothetical protein